MRPGDFIEWTYKNTDNLVTQDDALWSTLENRWVPIGLQSLLIWITDAEYGWLTPDGLFHARRDDTSRSNPRCHTHSAVPRTQG